MVKPENDRANHVIETGAEASASDYATLELCWVEVNIFPRGPANSKHGGSLPWPKNAWISGKVE